MVWKASTALQDGNGTETQAYTSAHVLTESRLFIVQGVATVACAIPAPFVLLDYPANALQLNAQEREIAMARLHADFGSHDSTEHISHAKAFMNAVKNWRLWLLCAGYMTIIGCYSLSYFNPSLVRGLGYTGSMAQYSMSSSPCITKWADTDNYSDRASLRSGLRHCCPCRYSSRQDQRLPSHSLRFRSRTRCPFLRPFCRNLRVHPAVRLPGLY